MRLPHPWYGSILWGVDFEGLPREDRRKSLASILNGLTVAVFSEAQLHVYPQLFDDAHAIAPACECLLHLNCMSIWSKGGEYWPRQNALREWADSDPTERYLWRGARIADGYPGTRLLNTCADGFVREWVDVCSLLPSACAGYFLDEAHDTRGWMSPPEDWPGELPFRAAIMAQIRIATKFGRAPAWINGTAGPTPASPRRYIQNAGASDPGYILNQCLASCENQPMSSRRILLQVDPRRMIGNEFEFWHALAAIGDAGVEFNGPPWSHAADTWHELEKSGAWGHGAVDENDNPKLVWNDDRAAVIREFDHAVVTVDLRARTALVERR